jgi:hypothetical protein
VRRASWPASRREEHRSAEQMLAHTRSTSGSSGTNGGVPGRETAGNPLCRPLPPVQPRPIGPEASRSRTHAASSQSRRQGGVQGRCQSCSGVFARDDRHVEARPWAAGTAHRLTHDPFAPVPRDRPAELLTRNKDNAALGAASLWGACAQDKDQSGAPAPTGLEQSVDLARGLQRAHAAHPVTTGTEPAELVRR